MVTCPTCGNEFDSDRAMKAHHQYHDKPYYDSKIEEELGISPERFLRKHHREEKLTLEQTAELIDATSGAIVQMAERHGVETLSPSEAKEAEWAQKSEEERKAHLKAAHEKTQKLVEEGEHNFQDGDFERVQTEEFLEQRDKQELSGALVEWWEGNEEKREEWGALGAEARDENGMAGVTGQDNPAWRGGKSILDSVKKQLHTNWRKRKKKAKERDNWTCQNCGTTSGKLDSHHIVPVMCGGTHDFENLMTLCEDCHTKAEWFIRQYPEFDPVLVE